jgi:hydrogenase maturation protease
MKNAECGTGPDEASHGTPISPFSFSTFHFSLPFHTLVLGLGNPLRGDDGAGLRVAEAIDARLRERPLPGVRVVASTRAGLDVIDLLAGASRAVIVDCLVAPDAHPGRIRRLTIDACPGSARLVGAHDLSLADAFALARATGVPMPTEVEVYGIEAVETLAIGEGLSPAVEGAVRVLAAEIYARLAVLANEERRMKNVECGSAR